MIYFAQTDIQLLTDKIKNMNKEKTFSKRAFAFRASFSNKMSDVFFPFLGTIGSFKYNFFKTKIDTAAPFLRKAINVAQTPSTYFLAALLNPIGIFILIMSPSGLFLFFLANCLFIAILEQLKNMLPIILDMFSFTLALAFYIPNVLLRGASHTVVALFFPVVALFVALKHLVLIRSDEYKRIYRAAFFSAAEEKLNDGTQSLYQLQKALYIHSH